MNIELRKETIANQLCLLPQAAEGTHYEHPVINFPDDTTVQGHLYPNEIMHW